MRPFVTTHSTQKTLIEFCLSHQSYTEVSAMKAERTAIRAAVLTEPREPLRIQQVYIDEPLPGEVRVRTLAAGLCHSDLHYLDGTLPMGLPAVLGHEVVGEIVAVGDE